MIQARITNDGRLAISREAFEEMKKYPGSPVQIIPILPESKKMRKFFDGGLVPYYAYIHGLNWKDHAVVKDARDDIKDEFWSEERVVFGKRKMVRKSTKGRGALKEVMEKLLDYYAENGYYSDACDPEKYKYWRDVVLTENPDSPDDYIDWLIETGALKPPMSPLTGSQT